MYVHNRAKLAGTLQIQTAGSESESIKHSDLWHGACEHGGAVGLRDRVRIQQRNIDARSAAAAADTTKVGMINRGAGKSESGPVDESDGCHDESGSANRDGQAANGGALRGQRVARAALQRAAGHAVNLSAGKTRVQLSPVTKRSGHKQAHTSGTLGYLN